MVLLRHPFTMAFSFIQAPSLQSFKVVQDHPRLPLDNNQYRLQIQMIGDEWPKNGLKVNNEVMEDILHLCPMVDDTRLAAGKALDYIMYTTIYW